MTIALHDDQRAAVALATSPDGPRICVITGSPGTGKSTATRAIVEHFAGISKAVACAAPTGKAALRLAEASGRPASTIHRILQPMPPRFEFSRTADNPLDADVVILDEASMIDIRLMASLTAALRPRARLILVGDVNQLPAVGPGNVLADVIASGRVPVARLTTIKRQNPGALLTGIHAIKDGRPPVIANRPGDDLFFDARETPDEIARTVVDLVTRRLPAKFPGLDVLRDVQVLTAMRERGPLGCLDLNRALQAALNGGRDDDAGSRPDAPPKLRLRDKVIQGKNDYGRGIINGDIGFVRGLERGEDGKAAVQVAFDAPARAVEVPAGENALTLAYACTVHKFQGSECRVVVIPLHASQAHMLTRSWVYTAISRAKECCVLVGSRAALSQAVKITRGTERTTGLASMVRAGAAA